MCVATLCCLFVVHEDSATWEVEYHSLYRYGILIQMSMLTEENVLEDLLRGEALRKRRM